jgi:G3E family GTPase
MQKIPFHIISGFLGSGKTTFLQKIIREHSGDHKLGIIQNEFAPANVDGAFLKQNGGDFNLLEINNGSVFCVCLLTDFARSLEKFIDTYQPEIIIMEASGMSDTTSVSEILTSGNLAEKIVLASNWCIVDSVNYGKTGMLAQRVSHQIRMADVVVINKTDLISDGTDRIKSSIKNLNPFAKIVETSFCNIDFIQNNLPVPKYYFNCEEPLSRPDVHSMVIKTSRKMSQEALLRFLEYWAHKACRIKGFVNLKNQGCVAVQCVFDQINLNPVDGKFFSTELVALTTEFTLSEWNKSFKEFSAV